jgi:uncharacterized protein (TIGR02466 family)
MITEFFSFPIIEEIIDIDRKELIDFSYELKKNTKGSIKSNVFSFQSDNINLELPILKPLIENIVHQCNIMHDFIGLKKNLRPNVSNLWINIHPKGGANIPHSHPGSYFSGVYYPKCDEQSGKLFFIHPASNYEYHNNNHTIDNFTIKNGARAVIVPQNNKLVIFPSWGVHYVTPNESENDRISIAFNANII